MDHELPAAPDAPVIEWSIDGGMADTGTGGPDLVVRADGRVEVGGRFGAGRRAAGRLPPARLQALLQAALDEHGFFGIDAAEIDAAVEAARRRRAAEPSGGDAVATPLEPRYTDAGSSRIMVAADGQRHEVRRHGLFAEARAHPEVPALQDLRALERRFLALAEEVAGESAH